MKQIVSVDSEFKSLIPPLREEERGQLEESIVHEGCRDALIAWDGLLLDGHHRFEICERNQIAYQIKGIDLADRNEAKIWIIKNQFSRRNLTPFQRAELALALKPLIVAKAKEKLSTHTKQGYQKSDKAEHTIVELASIAGVSHDTIHRAEVIVAKADEETKRELRVGETSINAEYNRLSGVHVSHNSGQNEWDTPPDFIAAAVRVMGGIDIDPASSERANKIVGAETFFTTEDNGLDKRWPGRVWMNPPYGQPLIVQFSAALVEKIINGETKEACVLVNNATETEWLQSMLGCCARICFIRGRVKFLDKQGKPSGAPLQGQLILYFGPNEKKFEREFSSFGIIR